MTPPGSPAATDSFKHFDPGTWLVAIVTLALFIAALFVKGLTHDLLLEAGVFLVSIKLLMMVHRIGVVDEELRCRLDEVSRSLRRIESSLSPRGPAE